MNDGVTNHFAIKVDISFGMNGDILEFNFFHIGKNSDYSAMEVNISADAEAG